MHDFYFHRNKLTNISTGKNRFHGLVFCIFRVFHRKPTLFDVKNITLRRCNVVAPIPYYLPARGPSGRSLSREDITTFPLGLTVISQLNKYSYNYIAEQSKRKFTVAPKNKMIK